MRKQKAIRARKIRIVISTNEHACTRPTQPQDALDYFSQSTVISEIILAKWGVELLICIRIEPYADWLQKGDRWAGEKRDDQLSQIGVQREALLKEKSKDGNRGAISQNDASSLHLESRKCNLLPRGTIHKGRPQKFWVLDPQSVNSLNLPYWALVLCLLLGLPPPPLSADVLYEWSPRCASDRRRRGERRGNITQGNRPTVEKEASSGAQIQWREKRETASSSSHRRDPKWPKKTTSWITPRLGKERQAHACDMWHARRTSDQPRHESANASALLSGRSFGQS